MSDFRDYVKRAYYQYYFDFKIPSEKAEDWVKEYGLLSVIRAFTVRALTLRYELLSIDVRSKLCAIELVLKCGKDVEVKVLTSISGDTAIHISAKDMTDVEYIREAIFNELNKLIKIEGEKQ